MNNFTFSLTEAILRSQSASGNLDHLPEGEKPLTITISREVGALGTSVGTELSKQLGWPLYDQDLVGKIAEETKRPTCHVRSVDEKYFNWLAECLTGLMSDYHISSGTYLKNLITIIRGLGLVGRAIIVGRAGNFILPTETTVRVRLVADRKDRVRTIGRLKGISDHDAERYIETTEAARTLFVKKNFNSDPTDPHNYDLVLNMSRLSVPEAAEQIVKLLHTFEKRNPVHEEEMATVS